MDFNEVLFGRRSVREYKPDPLAGDMVEALIAAAVEAPSAMNEQPWIFTVIRDKAMLDRISEASKAHMLSQAPAASPIRGMLGQPSFHLFYHAPALIVISYRGGTAMGVENCALAAQSLMLAACDAGLGSCWIGFAQSFLQTAEGRILLDLAADDVPVAPIIVGHPVRAAAPVPRKPADIRWIGG